MKYFKRVVILLLINIIEIKWMINKIWISYSKRGGRIGSFLRPWFNSLHKRVPGFSFGMMRHIGINDLKCEEKAAEPLLPPKKQYLPSNFYLPFLGELDNSEWFYTFWLIGNIINRLIKSIKFARWQYSDKWF